MKILLNVFLGIFVLLNLSEITYADNYATANGYNNTGHSLAYQYRMAEKQKSKSEYPEGIGTIILFIVVMIIIFKVQSIWD